MKTKIKKVFLFFLISIVFLSNTSLVYAFDAFSLSNPVGVENSILGDLGINKSELQYQIQTMNTSRQKKVSPQVMLTFEPSNPVPGEKVTVTATPIYFFNDIKNQYFTWYLKNKKCTDKTLDKKYTYTSDCDLNDDGKVNIEDYKIKAMRIIASNDFDYQNNSYSKQTTSNNGYTASSGGDDQKGKTAYCYFHDVNSGNEYELSHCGESLDGHLFAQGKDTHTTGDGSFTLGDEKFWHTNPGADDTAVTGNNDGANVAGLGENTFTFNYTSGDKVGVVVEGISLEPTQKADSSYKTMWAFSNNTCDTSNLDNDPTKNDYPQTDTSDSTTTDLPISCSSFNNCVATKQIKTIKDIVSGTTINDYGTIRTYTKTTTSIVCTDLATGLTVTPNPSGCESFTTNTATCNQVTSEPGGGSAVTYNNETYTCSGYDEYNQPLLNNDSKPTVQSLNNCLYYNLSTPSEGGGAKQKMSVSIAYGPQNPINDTTSDGSGSGDELSFKATVTNAQNPSYLNYEWQVYSGDSSDTENWTQLQKTAIPNASQTIGLGIDSFKFKLNFTDNPPSYLKVKLIVKDTISDSETKEGHADVIIPISSSSERIKIYPTTVSFDSATKEINSINIPSDAKELCLFKDPETKKENPSAVCSVAKNELLGIKIDNTNNEYTNFLWTLNGETLSCPDATVFDACLSSDKQTNLNYLPIIKEVGTQFTISLSATKNDGKQLSLTRNFVISNPSVRIIPKEQNNSENPSKYTCRGTLLGKYIDLSGKAWDDRSETEFQALLGEKITLVPTFSGVDLTRDTDRKKYHWTVDGIDISEANVTDYGYEITDGALTLPAKETGETYTIGFSVIYTQDSDKKQVLNKYANLTYNDFYEKQLTSNIQIHMVNTEIAKAKTGKEHFLATISSGIPSYISFIFRIVLFGLIIILATKILFFILPKNHYES